MSGGHYRLDPGEVIVTSIREIGFNDISETMANESGFSALEDLLKTAQHGTGLHIYFIRFYYSDNNWQKNAWVTGTVHPLSIL